MQIFPYTSFPFLFFTSLPLSVFLPVSFYLSIFVPISFSQMPVWSDAGVVVAGVLACLGVIGGGVSAGMMRSSDPKAEGLMSEVQLDPNLPQLPLGYPDTVLLVWWWW